MLFRSTLHFDELVVEVCACVYMFICAYVCICVFVCAYVYVRVCACCYLM